MKAENIEDAMRGTYEAPNFDLLLRACQTTSKALFPNFMFLDTPFNKNEKWKADDPKRYIYELATMGCRTRVFENVAGEKSSLGRGNLSFTTLNMPRLAIEARIKAEKDVYKRQVHTFSNFGPGYMDEDPIAMLNNKFSREYPPHVGTPYSPYTPCSSNALKRGMLLSKEQFDCAGHVKQKELFEYTPIQKDSILITEITTTNVDVYKRQQ